MKKIIFTLAIPLLFFLFTFQSEAQVVRRHKARVVSGKPAVNIARQHIRTKRRVRRRTYRRITRRTLNTLPGGTRALVYRNVNYYPVNGFYFVKQNAAYISVLPPVGFRLAVIPWSYTRLVVAKRTYFYANGLYYVQSKNQYEIVTPPVGAKIPELPEGYAEVDIGGHTYYSFDDTLYKSSDEGYQLVGFLDNGS
ncbi:MAG: DUF6515 family protein [Saonia sp.]